MNMDTNTKHKFTTGFTTIEIVIVIVAAVVLIGIILFAIKPSQKLIDSRNASQQEDIK